MDDLGCKDPIEQKNSTNFNLSGMKPYFLQDKNERQKALRKELKKLQILRCQLGRAPDDKIGRDPDGWVDFCQREQGKEELPGVSNRTSLHILTVTDDEIKEDTLKSKAFIERYYQAFDDQGNEYSIWTLLEKFRNKTRYYPEQITIEELSIINDNFEKHAKQILGQLSKDAAERHTREARKRKNIELIGMCLSAFTALGGAVTGFLGNSASKQNTQRLIEMGYAQVLIGIVIGSIIKVISNQVEEHTNAARNLDVTLSWVEEEIKRLKIELINLQEPFLNSLRSNQYITNKPSLPIEQQLLDMKYIWLKPHASLSAEKSLFESISQLQNILFGNPVTADSVEKALLDFKHREWPKMGLFKKPTDLSETSDFDLFAKIYECTILLISETLLPGRLHYQIINEPIAEKQLVIDEKNADEQTDEKADEEADEENVIASSIAIKQVHKMRYMVIYTTGDRRYQPILAPLNATWDMVKEGLSRLPSLTLDIPENEEELLSPAWTSNKKTF